MRPALCPDGLAVERYVRARVAPPSPAGEAAQLLLEELWAVRRGGAGDGRTEDLRDAAAAALARITPTQRIAANRWRLRFGAVPGERGGLTLIAGEFQRRVGRPAHDSTAVAHEARDHGDAPWSGRRTPEEIDDG